MSHPLGIIRDMAQHRSVTQYVDAGEAVEQPALLTLPRPPALGAREAGDREGSRERSVRSEHAKQLGLAGIAQARAALAAAAQRAEAEKVIARTASKAA